MLNGIPAHELRLLNNDNPVTKFKESKGKLFNLRFQSTIDQPTNNRRLRTVRKDIARVYTVIHECELGLFAAPTDGDAA